MTHPYGVCCRFRKKRKEKSKKIDPRLANGVELCCIEKKHLILILFGDSYISRKFTVTLGLLVSHGKRGGGGDHMKDYIWLLLIM